MVADLDKATKTPTMQREAAAKGVLELFQFLDYFQNRRGRNGAVEEARHLPRGGRQWQIWLAAFLGALTGTVLFFVIVAVWTGNPLRDAVLSAHGLLAGKGKTHLDNESRAILLNLIEQGQLIPTDSLVSNIMQYYSGVIDIFVGIIAALAFVSYMYVRGVSEENAEKSAERAVDRHFDSIAFERKYEAFLARQIAARQEGYDALLKDLQDRIDFEFKEIAEKLKKVESAIANLDQTEEDVGGEIAIDSAGVEEEK